MTDLGPLPVTPVKDNVLIKELFPEETSPGGIIKVEDPNKTPYRMGTVLKVGPGMTTETDSHNSHIPPHVKEGRVVLFHRQGGWDIPWPDGRDYVIVSCRQIEAVVSEEYAAWRLAQSKKD